MLYSPIGQKIYYWAAQPIIIRLIRTLQCDAALGLRYKNATQIARVVSEHWCSSNLYCAACDTEALNQAPTNAKAVDFYCGNCNETYQLKSQRRLNLKCVPDGAYNAMLAAVKKNIAPNLLILNYNAQWIVSGLFLVPALFFTESVLRRRHPLSRDARRAGWVGCNIILSNVPGEAKIPLVENAEIAPPSLVRQRFAEFRKFGAIDWSLRGWTIDILRIVSQLGDSFTLQQAYKHEPTLARLHPANRNIRAKIRQQLQVLRDFGFLEFVGQGRYQFTEAFSASFAPIK
jgi:type II restriction enzyme